MNDRLSVTDIKRQHVQIKKALRKKRAKVAHLRKLRTETFHMVDQLATLEKEEQDLRSFMWTPPSSFNSY